jgi:RHS repeat-associated protein
MRGYADTSYFAETGGTNCLSTVRCASVSYPVEYWMPAFRQATIVGAFHGSLLMDKADASGHLYRRNRYYDPNTGRFTQEDPLGLAGGLNVYGFANGDPVSYSDPFGLCVDKDVNCQNLVRMLREQKGSEFHAAADRYDAQKTGRVFFYSRQQNTSNRDAYNVDGDPGTYQLGNTRGTGGDVFLRGDVSTSDFLLTAVHESGHLAGDGGETGPTHAAWRAYNQLSPGARSSAIYNANIFFKLWGTGYGAPLPAGTKESRDRQVYFVPSP